MKLTEFSEDLIRETLLPLEEWVPFPRAAGNAWRKLLDSPLNLERSKRLFSKADEIAGKTWETIPLSLYYDFIRSGDRESFEKPYMSRRHDIAAMTLASCFDPKPRYCEKLADMLWTVCEESSWAISAHADRKLIGIEKDIVPSLISPTVELFSCETAAVLAEASYLLADQLDAISPSIRERTNEEIERRIIAPFESRSDFFWLPYKNNWTPWCISSVFIAAAYVLSDRSRLARLIRHGLDLLEPFIEAYPKDFSCDEGPSYWNASPGALLLIAETLHSRSGGALDPFGDTAFEAMGRYLGHMRLTEKFFFNYADSPADMSVPIFKVYRYGERIGDDLLRKIALDALMKGGVDGKPDFTLGIGRRCGDLISGLRELFWVPAQTQELSTEIPQCIFYPEAQLLVARESRTSDQGLVLAVKGGHNNENHNHNDLGEFLICANGEPVIADPGRGSYTRRNFSDERYSIWWNAARGHDLLRFGQFEQAPGADRLAKLLSYSDGNDETAISLELCDSFPPEAGLLSWIRTCILQKGDRSQIIVKDAFRLKNAADFSIPLFSPISPEISKEKIIFPLKDGKILEMAFDSKIMKASEARLEAQDSYMNKCWKCGLKKILLHSICHISEGESTLLFQIKN